MREAFIISGIYVTTVIGAGFASGSEIISYFLKYGKISLLGVALAAILFGLLLYSILKRAEAESVSDFGEYLHLIMPRPTARLIASLTGAFMLVVFVTMCSGAGEVLTSCFGIKREYGIILMTGLCVLIILFGFEGFSACASALSVVICGGIVLCCAYLFFHRETAAPTFAGIADNAVTASVCYVSYNLLTAGFVVVEAAARLKRLRPGVCAVMSGSILFVLLLSLWGIIGIYYGNTELYEIPMLTICARSGRTVYLLYAAVLFCSMLTTAASGAYSAAACLERHFGKRLSIVLLAAAGCLGGSMSFSFLVGYVYRAMGFLSMLMTAYILADIFLPNKMKF